MIALAIDNNIDETYYDLYSRLLRDYRDYNSMKFTEETGDTDD
jgi:hypothetical protein